MGQKVQVSHGFSFQNIIAQTITFHLRLQAFLPDWCYQVKNRHFQFFPPFSVIFQVFWYHGAFFWPKNAQIRIQREILHKYGHFDESILTYFGPNNGSKNVFFVKKPLFHGFLNISWILWKNRALFVAKHCVFGLKGKFHINMSTNIYIFHHIFRNIVAKNWLFRWKTPF